MSQCEGVKEECCGITCVTVWGVKEECCGIHESSPVIAFAALNVGGV